MKEAEIPEEWESRELHDRMATAYYACIRGHGSSGDYLLHPEDSEVNTMICQCCGSSTWPRGVDQPEKDRNIYRMYGEKEKPVFFEEFQDFLIKDKESPGPFYIRWRDQ